MLSRSVVFDSLRPYAIALQAPLSIGFPRQEHWRGLHFLLQGNILTQVLNPFLLHLLHWQEDSAGRPFSNHKGVSVYIDWYILKSHSNQMNIWTYWPISILIQAVKRKMCGNWVNKWTLTAYLETLKSIFILDTIILIIFFKIKNSFILEIRTEIFTDEIIWFLSSSSK